jgi:large subunit ribosomal protein L1
MKALTQFASELGTLPVVDAVRALKSLEDKMPKAIKRVKFDQTVELAIRLGVDPRQADQIVRGSIVLPHGIGKSQRVLVFSQGDNVKVAQAAGADHVGGKELADKVKEGWLEFDVAIATPDMMGVVGPLGRVLGPRGLMPSPRAGTVTQDVATAVREYKAGKVEFRVDNGANLHCVVGKMSFDAVKLQENIESLLTFIRSLKPNTSKGVYLRMCSLSATMMPAITVAV